MSNFFNNGPSTDHLGDSQYTIMALGRGEYPKLSTPLGLFPQFWIFTDSEDRNCFIIPNKQLKYTV
jgi:hypothetical protein